jgi:hypothetical protein
MKPEIFYEGGQEQRLKNKGIRRRYFCLVCMQMSSVPTKCQNRLILLGEKLIIAEMAE